MIEHRFQITDKRGANFEVSLRVGGRKGRWVTLNKGFLRYEQGVCEVGAYEGQLRSWVSLFGGERFDDDKLVLHLDLDGPFTHIRGQGTGKLYKQDHVIAEPGELRWQLVQ